MKWKMSQDIATGAQRIVISGKIDEHAKEQLAELAGKLTPGPVLFDMRDVHQINSVGISQWARFLVGISPTVAVTYEQCSLIFMDAFAIVPGLSEKTKIASFFALFTCSACGRQGEALVQVRDVLADSAIGPKPCVYCGGRSEVEIEAEELVELVKELKPG